DDVDRSGPDQYIGDLESLFAMVRLGDEQLFDVDADPPRVSGIDGVLGVDECANATDLLRLRDDLIDERGLSGRLGAEYLDDPATGNSPDAEREIERQRTRRDHRDGDRRRIVTEAHHRALAELALDLRDRGIQGRSPCGITPLALFFGSYPLVVPE